MSGKATTVAAITVAGQEKTIVMPMFSNAWPIKLRRPKITSRIKPTTVGGKTSGSVRMPSIQARMLHVRRTLPMQYMLLAVNKPRKNVAIVAAQVVASETISGDRSICGVTVLLL